MREEVAVCDRPFCKLVHFAKDAAVSQPRVLIVAPLSGHFATLLRGTVSTMLPDHEVYITDWQDAREIPLSSGLFELEDFIDYLIRFIEHLGPRTHVVAICQPAVAALAAVAVMAEDGNPAVPAELDLDGGADRYADQSDRGQSLRGQSADPVVRPEHDQHRSPAVRRRRSAGLSRILQLSAFMSLNLDRHAKAWRDMVEHLALGETRRPRRSKTSTTSISRSWICRRNSTCKPCIRFFSSMPCRGASCCGMGGGSSRGRSPEPPS